MSRTFPPDSRSAMVALLVTVICLLPLSVRGQPPATAPRAADAEPTLDEAENEAENAAEAPELRGYSPPSPPHAMLAIENELLTPAELQEYKSLKPAFNSAMNDGALNGDKRGIVEKGLKILVLRLSLESNRNDLPGVRAEVERWIKGAATKKGINENVRLTFRSFMLDRIIENTEKLLDGNLEVRLQAMLLLNRCVIIPADPFKKTPEQFYVGTFPLFVKVLKDHEQHPVVRVWAAKGLQKVLERGLDLGKQQRFAIAEALMEELVPGHNDEWLDMRIAEAAGDAGIVRYGGSKPVVVQGLVQVLNDSERSPLVRSEAAKQLARVTFDPASNLSLFAHETVRLVHEMSVEQARNPNSAKWRVCFLNAYLAFVPVDRDELNSKDAGLVVRARKATTHEKYVRDALEQIAPLADHVVGERWRQPLPPAQIQQLDGWLRSNPPPDWKPTPDLDALEVKRVADSPPPTPPAG